jgi:hypothetical protein
LNQKHIGTFFACSISNPIERAPMRINKASEAVLAKYAAPEKKLHIEPLYKTRTGTKKGASLKEFYEEVYAKGHYQIEQVYNGKNANEIELMMMKNRKLIENHQQKRS